MANMLYSSGDHTPPWRAPAAPALSPSQAEYANAATTTHRPTPASPTSTSDPSLAARSARRLADSAATMRCQSCQPTELDILARWLPAVPTCNNSHAFRFEMEKRVAQHKLCPSLFPFTPMRNAGGDFRTCIRCGNMEPKNKRCSGCMWARYCSRDCQKADWRTHRSVCCPDHALPRHQRNIRYAEIVIPVGECSSSSTAASNLSVRSAISASSSSTDSLTEAEHVAFRKEFFGPISKEEIKHTLDTVLARYPPSEPAWPIDPRWCNLCQKWLRDEAQYDDHLINHTRRKHAKRIALAQGGRVEQ
jgi:hypothetical protein